MDSVKKKKKKKILDLGFDLVGFSDPHVDEDTSIKLKKYLNKNYHGEMKWLERHYEKSKSKKIWDKVKTIIVLGLNYGPNENPFILNSFKKKANISVYAKNKDYHSIINKQLNKFKEWFDFEFKNECKIFVDTAPVMEKYLHRKVILDGKESIQT